MAQFCLYQVESARAFVGPGVVLQTLAGRPGVDLVVQWNDPLVLSDPDFGRLEPEVWPERHRQL